MERTNKVFAIGIPTLNRFDLLYPNLLKYVVDFPDTHIYILDNGKQEISKHVRHTNIILVDADENLGVAKSWNRLCDLIFKEHEFAAILNDDIYWGCKQYQIMHILEKQRRDLYISYAQWSVFIMPKKTYKRVGFFDENFFPAYYEDNDYTRRMKLENLFISKYYELNPKEYLDSQTAEKDPKFWNRKEQLKYYIEKWGGEPEHEKYRFPFDNSDHKQLKPV
jgi:GT2 family glycosyltransferase